MVVLIRRTLLLASGLTLVCAVVQAGGRLQSPSTASRTSAADAMPGDETDGRNWSVYGRSFSANHYSPLSQIGTSNVARLGLVWFHDLPSTGSLYTSPVAVDGILYFAQVTA